jgi:hypothetical protein
MAVAANQESTGASPSWPFSVGITVVVLLLTVAQVVYAVATGEMAKMVPTLVVTMGVAAIAAAFLPRHRVGRILAFGVGLVLVIGGGYALVQPKTFQADPRVVVSPSTVLVTQSTGPTSTAAPANGNRPTASGLTFRVPDNASVPECSVFQGDGRIPSDGYSLVIFDRPVDASGQSTDGYYMTRKPAQNNDQSPGWRTPLLDIGSPRVEIAAVLMPNDLFQALLSVKPNATNEAPDAWKFWTLPPGEQLRTLVVEPRLRTATDPSGCPN